METRAFYEKDVIIFDSISALIANDASEVNVDDLMAFLRELQL